MVAKIEKIVLADSCGEKELRVSFDNDRHHAVIISHPHTADKLAEALITLAMNLRKDHHLKEK